MAAGLMRRMFGDRVFVDSVGLRAEASPDFADPFMVAVMDEIGVDLTAHVPRTFEDLEDQSFDLVISLTPQSHHRAVEMARGRATEIAYWPILDPTLAGGSREMRLGAYREVRDQLEARIRDRFGPVRTFGG
ncbi:MAG: low molecular weight phosphatase family protein [Alphaproteobacteria bacterium]|nr:low molecular weight phosphatase family protein [Alphaproteobacteria bacterium]